MDPVTLAVTGAAIAAVSSYAEGKSAQEMAEFNAEMAEIEAGQIRDVAQIEEEQHRDKLRRFIGSQKAAAGASGFSSSSAGLLSEEAAALGERDALMIRYSGSVEAAKKLSEASVQRFAGKVAFREGVLGAGASILKGTGVATKKLGTSKGK